MYGLGYLVNFITGRKIENKNLEDNGIVILKMEEITLNNKKKICTTAFGEFYYGEYNNQKVIIKVVDITKDDKILNEFLLYKLYQGKEFCLTIKGVGLNSLEAYIVFEEYFQNTLETYLKKKTINFDDKIKITNQLLNILSFFQEKNEFILNIQPDNFCVDNNLNVKLLDFGYLVNKNTFQNEEIIKNKRIKYSPPEYILNNKISTSFDIYSFGCLLIDIFNEKNYKIIYSDFEYDYYLNEIPKGNFPKIYDSNKIIYAIIYRCLEKDIKTRMKIQELKINLGIFLKNFSRINIISSMNNENEELYNDFLEGDDIKENYKYAIELDKKILDVNDFVNGQLQENIIALKNNLLNIQDNCSISIDNFNSQINTQLDKYYESHKNYIEIFGSKMLENFINLQDYCTDLLDDLVLIQNNSMNIKLNLTTVNQFENKDFYKQYFSSFEESKKEINEIIKKHSEKVDFDKLPIMYKKSKLILESYKNYSEQCSSSFKIISEQINNLYKTSEELKNQLLIDLNMEEEIKEKESNENNSKNENENTLSNDFPNYFYFKPEENSNRLLIYNSHTKKHYSQELENIIFPNKSYSIYDNENNIIYISGGLKDLTDKNSITNSFIKISLTYNKNLNSFNTNIIELTPMNNYHYSHVIYQLSNKKNLIICISGKDTKSCEIYNIDENQWSNLPDFPIFSPNSECFDLNENIYVICGSFNIDGIYKLNMENDNENLIWENVNFIIEEGRLRRGMGLFNLNGIIYLFGGFDNDKYYDDVYTIDFNSDDIRVNFEHNMKLPCKSYFNSNTISVEYDNKEKRIVLVDCFNGIIEYSTNTNFFYFYP